MQAHERKKIEQTITMLQEVLGQKGGPVTSIPKINIPMFDQ